MSALRCADVERFVDAYLDGEFSADDRVTFDAHLTECAECHDVVRFQADYRNRLRAAYRAPAAPPALRARIVANLAPGESHTGWSWRLTPAVAATGLLATILWSASPPAPLVSADAIAKHRRELPMEVSGNEEAVRAWFENKLDFAVHPPHLAPGSVLRGARLANVRDREAAYLIYDVNGEKVSVLVFDPRELQLAGQRRVIGNHEVFLDGARGYRVALYRDRDVGYAVTSDVDEDQMIRMVSTAVSH